MTEDPLLRHQPQPPDVGLWPASVSGDPLARAEPQLSSDSRPSSSAVSGATGSGLAVRTKSVAAGSIDYARRATHGHNILAIVAIVMSCIGLVTFICAPVGAVLGHLARRAFRSRLAASSFCRDPLALTAASAHPCAGLTTIGQSRLELVDAVGDVWIEHVYHNYAKIDRIRPDKAGTLGMRTGPVTVGRNRAEMRSAIVSPATGGRCGSPPDLGS